MFDEALQGIPANDSSPHFALLLHWISWCLCVLTASPSVGERTSTPAQPCSLVHALLHPTRTRSSMAGDDATQRHSYIGRLFHAHMLHIDMHASKASTRRGPLSLSKANLACTCPVVASD